MTNLNYLHILLALVCIYSQASAGAIKAVNIAPGKLRGPGDDAGYVIDGIISSDNYFRSGPPDYLWSVAWDLPGYFIQEVRVFALGGTRGHDLEIRLARTYRPLQSWTQATNRVFINASEVAYRHSIYTLAFIEKFVSVFVISRYRNIFYLTEVQVFAYPEKGFVPGNASLVPDGDVCVRLSWIPPIVTDHTVNTWYEFRCDGKTDWTNVRGSLTARICDHAPRPMLTCEVGVIGTRSVITASTRILNPVQCRDTAGFFNIDHGHAITAGDNEGRFYYGDMFVYGCVRPYAKTYRVISCKIDGKWSATPGCVARWCTTAPPTIDHATYRLSRYNLTAIYQCDIYYVPNRKVISLCSTPNISTTPMTWKTPQLSCRREFVETWCKTVPPTMDHATYRLSQDNLSATYQCDSGYMSNSEMISVCSSPNILTIPWTWNTPQSSCLLAQWCKTAPPTMDHATYRLSGDNLTAIYKCDRGYMSIHEVISVCSSPSISIIPWTWNTPQSSCHSDRRSSTGSVAVISNGILITSLVIVAIGFIYYKSRKSRRTSIHPEGNNSDLQNRYKMPEEDHPTSNKSKGRNSLQSNQSAMLKNGHPSSTKHKGRQSLQSNRSALLKEDRPTSNKSKRSNSLQSNHSAMLKKGHSSSNTPKGRQSLQSNRSTLLKEDRPTSNKSKRSNSLQSNQSAMLKKGHQSSSTPKGRQSLQSNRSTLLKEDHPTSN